MDEENVSISVSNAVPDWSVKCNEWIATLPKVSIAILLT
jgi:hypothetical protein